MEFCSFVPEAARSYLLELVNGEPPTWDGLKHLAGKAKERLDRLVEKNQDKVGQGKLLSVAEIEEERRAMAHYEQLLGDLKAIQRLGTDYQMAPAYKAFQKKLWQDDALRRFLHAAWGARINFLQQRESLEKALLLSQQIANDADLLVVKIRDLSKTLTDTPLELHSIPELLRQTDNNELDGHNRGMWRIHRGLIIGDPPLDQKDTAPTKQDLFTEPTPPSDTDLYRANVRYAWTLAPDFAQLLSRISEIMGDFVPQKHGYIGAGITSREANEKTAYIRGLYELLQHDHGLKIDLPIKQAMAAVTAVMLNNPDIDVTTNDVTKAIEYYEKKGGR